MNPKEIQGTWNGNERGREKTEEMVRRCAVSVVDGGDRCAFGDKVRDEGAA
jgi:hypothetical protein